MVLDGERPFAVRMCFVGDVGVLSLSSWLLTSSSKLLIVVSCQLRRR